MQPLLTRGFLGVIATIVASAPLVGCTGEAHEAVAGPSVAPAPPPAPPPLPGPRPETWDWAGVDLAVGNVVLLPRAPGDTLRTEIHAYTTRWSGRVGSAVAYVVPTERRGAWDFALASDRGEAPYRCSLAPEAPRARCLQWACITGWCVRGRDSLFAMTYFPEG